MFEVFAEMPHVIFGVMGILAAVWALVELLNLSKDNLKRLEISSVLSTVFIWLSYLIGGWWYWVYYGAKDIGDKFIIKAGEFPWAHSYFMEVKEHIFFILLLVSMVLPIIVFKENLLDNKNTRKIAIAIAIIMVILGFGMEGFGSMIAKGVKIGLLGGM